MMRAEWGFVVPTRPDSPQRTILGEWPAMTAHNPTSTALELKAIPGFDGYYVGRDGTIWSDRSASTRRDSLGVMRLRRRELHPIRPRLVGHNRPGYLCVFLRRLGVRKETRLRVHRLVLEAFIGPRPEGMVGCHNDGNPLNNAVENLRWDTPKANSADRATHGTLLLGRELHSAKLSEDDVREIRRLRAAGEQYKPIAERFGVTKQAIFHVCKRQSWAHVE